MQAKRDQNSVPTLLGVSSTDGQTPITLYADPTTHRLLVDVTGGGTTTVDVGTTTTLPPASSATVTNSGTPENAILDFGIPAGSVIYSTFGIPSNTVGVNGDWAFDTSTNAYVYYKSAGAWSQVNSLKGPAGATGPQGPAGDPIVWLGNYNAGTTYQPLDAVFYPTTGSSYICTATSTGNVPTNTGYWNLMAEKGADGAGSGTVTSVSVSTANGLAGTVANSTTTPAITLSTTVTGILKGNGTAISAATAGVDYGDVVGPASATDNAITRFDLTTGKLIQNSTVTLDDNGNIASPLSVQFGNGSAVTLAAGKMWYDNLTGSLNFGMGGGNITQQVGEEMFIYGKASATITDSPLQIIYKTGTVGASGVIQFAPTVASITDADLIIGVATESIATNGFGRITTHGVVNGITTNGTAYGETWADGDVIWYNPVTGNPTKTKPVAPNIKISLGTVINAGSGGSGSFLVDIGSSSTLGGTDSNVQLGTLSNNDLLQYDSTAGYWKNVAIGSASGVQAYNANTTILGNTTTGSGSIVLATSPSLTTPTLGIASATSINKVTITAPATGSTLTILDGKTLTANNSITIAGVDGKTFTANNSITLAGTDGKTLTTNSNLTLGGTDGKSLTVNNSLTLAGTDSTTMTFPSTSATIARTDAAQSFTGVQTITNLTLPTNGQILLTAPSTDGHATGPTTNSFNSGYSTTAVGDLVYLDSSATWQKTDANTLALYNGLLGIALEAKTSGQALLVALPNSFVYATGFPTLTVGSPVYMSETAGAITQTQPTTTDAAIRVIGWAIHADKIYFCPSPDYITHT